VQDYKVVVSSLMKLAGGSPSLAAELNVDAFLRQVPHSVQSRLPEGSNHVSKQVSYMHIQCFHTALASDSTSEFANNQNAVFY
jgi:hypothetical protein